MIERYNNIHTQPLHSDSARLVRLVCISLVREIHGNPIVNHEKDIGPLYHK